MSVTNNWEFVGIVLQEPKLMKIGDGKVMARTIIKVIDREPTEVPIVAFNKKAHVLCALAHIGSTIYAKGVFKSVNHLTSKEAKTLIELSMKLTDFAVLVKEPIETGVLDYVDIVQLYDPENFIEKEEEENVK